MARRTPDPAPTTRVSVRVQPGSRAPGLRRDDAGVLVVAVRERATEGRANEAVARALAEALDVPPSRVRLTHGATSRTKVFLVDGDHTDALERLGRPD